MNKINHAHVVNETNQTNQINQTKHLRLGSRTHDAIWKVQGYGLVLITFLSFFPFLHNIEVYLFFTLLPIAVGAAWLDGKTIWVRTPIDLPLLLFVGWVFLTVPFAIDPAYSFTEWRKLAAKVLMFYWALSVLRMAYSPIFSPFGGEGKEREEIFGRSIIRGVLTAVVLGTAAICAYALADFVASGGTLEARDVRARAPFSSSQWLATYIVIAIPLMVSFGAIMKARWQRLACYVCLVIPSLLTLFFTYTRAAWVSVVVQGIAFSLFTGRPRLVIWILGTCLASILVLSGMSQLGHHIDIGDPGSTILRLTVWNMSIEEVLKHPVVGIGYGNDTFAKRFKDYLRTAPERELDSPHRAFLMIAMGSGIPALLLITWVLVSAIRCLVSSAYSAYKVSDRVVYALTIGVAIMVIGFAVRNLFDYMFAGSLAYLFWILLAVGMSRAMNGLHAVSPTLPVDESLLGGHPKRTSSSFRVLGMLRGYHLPCSYHRPAV